MEVRGDAACGLDARCHHGWTRLLVRSRMRLKGAPPGAVPPVQIARNDRRGESHRRACNPNSAGCDGKGEASGSTLGAEPS